MARISRAGDIDGRRYLLTGDDFYTMRAIIAFTIFALPISPTGSTAYGTSAPPGPWVGTTDGSAYQPAARCLEQEEDGRTLIEPGAPIRHAACARRNDRRRQKTRNMAMTSLK